MATDEDVGELLGGLPPGTRLTAQRRAILHAIAAWEGAFTVLQLFDRARHAYPSLGLATAYRTVELLRREGRLQPLPRPDGPAYVHCQPGHHHHLVCRTCGAVEDTELCAVPAPADIKRVHGFDADAHTLDIYGTCARCT